MATAPQVLYPDDLHSMLPRPVSSEPRTAWLVDSLGRPLGPPDVIQPVSHVASASTGFDWSDAGIGAVGVFGLMLLGIGVLLVGRHNRRSRLAATLTAGESTVASGPRGGPASDCKDVAELRAVDER